MSVENADNMSVDSNSDDLDDDDGTFYFESDHLALRDNPDYCNALRLICKLQAQRIRITEQMEQLILVKNRYLENPELVVKKLQNNEPIVDEKYLTMEKIPEIDANSVLAKYDIKMREEFDPETKQPTVRGRVLDETKPKKFNQLWTDEEQRRLDELLIEYPAEEVEMRRFAKIAKALGNRTTQQVSSRVQKYFQKLHEAGLPIPGRAPKNRRSGLATRFKTNFRPTTFFPAFNVPVNMPEDEQLFSDFDSTMQSPTFGRESENSIKPDTDTIEGLNKQDAHERKLFMLKKIREEKHQNDGYNPDPLAPKCENCNASEVTKIRWYCQTCYCYIKLCLDCLVEQLLLDQFDHISHNVVINNES